jgi:chorismate mutase-like protein
LGVKLEIVPTSWPTLMKDFGDERFDIAMGGVSVTPARQKQGLFSIVYLCDGKTPITDAIETRLQQRLHPQLCAVHPDTPFDASEKAILLPRDAALKVYVDQWLHQLIASGALQKNIDRWLDYPWGLEPLRQAIDQRLLLAQAVARAKWNAQAPIEDLPREAQVIQAAVKQGTALGLPAEWIEAVFRAQIEASKTVQRELFAKWAAQQAGRFDDAPDLAKTVRPELDRITAQLLHSMVVNQAILRELARKIDVSRAMRPLEARGLSPSAAEQAMAPFAK